MSPRCSCGTAKRTRIGRIWLITTRGSGEFARTRLPSRTSKRPVRPAIGARIAAHSRLSRALATAAESEALQAAVRADSAAVANARLNLEWAAIRAPIAGRTGRLLVREGNLV